MSSDATFSHKNAGDIDNERLEKVGPIDLPFKLKKDALRVNSDHVQSVYNDIAPHFNQTRTYIWPKVKEYIESLPPWSVVLDVGCGNGRNMNLRKTDLFLLAWIYRRNYCTLLAGIKKSVQLLLCNKICRLIATV